MRRLFSTSVFILILFSATNSFAQFGDMLKINGYSSFEFEKQFGDKGDRDQNGSFDADMFDLVFNVSPTERLRVAADLTWEHGAASEDSRGNVAIEYAFAQYTIKNWFKVRAGKMFTHFGIYNEIHTAKPATVTVKEPITTNKPHKAGTSGQGGAFFPRWLSGIAVLGNFEIASMDADYIVQIANGENDENPYDKDDNTEKAIAGRFRIWPTYDLQLGVSIYSDKLTELDANLNDTGNRTDLFSYGAQAIYTKGNFGLELEFVGSNYTPSFGNAIKRYGYTVMGTYNLFEVLTPYVRYEFLDPNTDIDEDVANVLVYGLNYQISQSLYLKGELNTINSGDLNNRFNGEDFTEFKFAVAVGF